MNDKNYIQMGTITRPHGIKGELCVDCYAHSPELLCSDIYLQAGDEPLRLVSKAKIRMHKERPLITLPFIKDRTEAESMRGMRIYVHKDNLPELEDDEAYIHEILGFAVFDSRDNNQLGHLIRVEFPSEQDLWVIENADGKEILLPAVEEFIDDIDIENQSLFVTPPDGLVELYLDDMPKDKSDNTPKE